MTWRIIAYFRSELRLGKSLNSQVKLLKTELLKTAMDYLFCEHSLNWLDARSHWQMVIELHKKIKCALAVKCWLIPTAKTQQFPSLYRSSLNSHPFLEREEMWFIFSFFDLWCHWHVGSEMNLKLSWPQTIVLILDGAAKKILLVPLGQWSSTFHQHLTSLFI